MTAVELVLLVVAIETLILAAAVITIFGHAIASRAASRRRAGLLAAGRSVIASHLESRAIPPPLMKVLWEMPRPIQAALFFQLAPNMGGVERAWLRGLADELGLLASAQGLVTSKQWWHRLPAARLLSVLDPDPSVMLPLFGDRNPLVRVQAAHYVAQHSFPEGITALIRMLADDDPFCRIVAKDALMRLGAAAAPTIVSRLRDPADPQAIPLLEIASASASPIYLEAAVAHRNAPNPQVRWTIARLLRGIGGADAAVILAGMVTDDSPRVRAAATEAIGYLNHWEAAPAVAKLLDDPVSRVRLAAALALDTLGPTGELLLRRARARGSELAATAARRILEDPTRRHAPRTTT